MVFHARKADGTEIGELAETEFRRRIFTGELQPEDYYWREGMADWSPVSTYHVPSPGPASQPGGASRTRRADPAPALKAIGSVDASRPAIKKKDPLAPGWAAGLLIASWFLPAIWLPLFLVSIAVAIVVFVIAVVTVVRGRPIAGIVLIVLCMLSALMVPAVIWAKIDIETKQHPTR